MSKKAANAEDVDAPAVDAMGAIIDGPQRSDRVVTPIPFALVPTRRSLRSNSNADTADANDNTAPSTDSSMAAITPGASKSKSKVWKGSDEARSRRNGAHPKTGLEVNNCACIDSAQCRKIMWKYAL